jgi:ParB/RepB/Spo0J family partition protein
MSPECKELALDTLSISPYNVRKDPGDLTDIIDSVTDIGVVDPISVVQRGERYEVIAGSRRVEAARRAGHTTIPAIVHEITDAQAIRISLIENLHRKDLTLAERVEGYKELQAVDPLLHSPSALAKATGQAHQKITQDFQAYEMLHRLSPLGITVASHLQPTDPRRQQGEVLPEYHAVLLYQVMPYVTSDDAEAGEATEEQLLVLARKLASMSQAAAKAYIDAVKRRRDARSASASKQDEEASTPPWHDTVTVEADGGIVMCAYCQHQLSLVHFSDGTHQVKPYSLYLKDQKELPAFNT